MADSGEAQTRKKLKKKHKKQAKTAQDEHESTTFDSADTNASRNEKDGSAQPRKAVTKESKSSPEKVAAKLESSKAQWTREQEGMLLKNLKSYVAKLNEEKQFSHYVDWSVVTQVDNFSQFEMQAQYKTLTKKVRKLRSVGEIVDDAFTLHNEKLQSSSLPKTKKFSKQPPNAFSVFCKAKRASVTAKYPDLSFGIVHKKICERWKELPDEKREKYVAKAENEKLKYYEELRKFEEEMVSNIKKPMTAFDLWKCERSQDGDLEGDANENDFLLEWEGLPKSSKKGWMQAAAAEKETYNLKVKSITKGTNGKEKKKAKNVKATVAQTKLREERASDEQQLSSSSGLKRKTDGSKQAITSPAKKAKKESSDSESSESADLKTNTARSKKVESSPVKKTTKNDSSDSESSESVDLKTNMESSKKIKNSTGKKTTKKESSSSESSESSDED